MKNKFCRDITIFLMVCFFINFKLSGNAQSLKIGEKCPDLILSNTINYTSEELRLSQKKPKLILLDFWSPICLSCIQAFPHIDSLQQEFEEQVLIATVTATAKDSVLSFFKNRPFLKLPRVPFVTTDTVLHKLFEPKFLPWHVWLDSNLVVRYITDGSNATGSNIQAFLNGENLDLYQLVGLPEKPKINNNNSQLKYYSYIAPCVPGTKNIDEGGASDGKVYFSKECTSIIDLVKWVLGKIDNQYYDYKYPLVIEATDKERFSNSNHIPKNTWVQKYSFSYYLMIPSEKGKKMYDFALSDIERYFGIKVLKEKKELPCLILQKDKRFTTLKTKGGEPIDNLNVNTIVHPVYSNKRYIRNMPFQVFANKIKTWSEYVTRIPFIDETGINYNIDISFEGDMIDSMQISKWNEAFAKYGLALVRGTRFVDAIVIQDAE